MLHRYLKAKRKRVIPKQKKKNMPKPKENTFKKNRYAVSSNTPQTLYEGIAGGAKHVYASIIDLQAAERPRTLL